MKLTDIIRTPEFRKIAAILRLTYTTTFTRAHKDIPLLTQRDLVAKLAFDGAIIKTNPDEFFREFSKLLTLIEKASPRMRVSVADLTWLTEKVKSKDGYAILALLMGYSSAKDRMVTPAMLGEITDKSSRTWRDRARAGDIPGAFQTGSNEMQWLIPVSVVEVMYGITIPDDDERQDNDIDIPELTEEQIEEAVSRLNKSETTI